MSPDRLPSRLEVLHIIDSLGRSGGAEQQLVANLRRFDDPRLEHRILCLYERPGDTRRPDVPDGVETQFLFSEGRRSRNRLTLAARVYLHLSRRTPDLIHCALPDAALASRLAGRIRGVPVIESLVNISHEPVRTVDNEAVTRAKLYAHRRLDRLTMRWVKRFQALSEAVKDSWIEQVSLDAERIVVIPRGVDVTEFASEEHRPKIRAEFRSEIGLGDDSFVIVNIGRQVAQKGQIYAIRALSSVLKTVPSAFFVSAGTRGGASSALEAEVRRLGLEDRVRWLGVRDDVPRLLASGDVFVFPSLYEGLGVALLEAMASGIPCVTTNRRPMTEVVSHESNGLIVPARDASAIADALMRLARDPVLGRRLGEQARADVITRFDVGEVARRVERLYLETLGQEKSGS